MKQTAEERRLRKNANQREYYAATREKWKAYCKTYHAKNRDKNLADMKAYDALPSSKAKRSARHKRRYASDPQYKLRNLLRNRFYDTLTERGRKKGAKGDQSVLDLLGCSLDEFRDYIAAQFQPGMTWDNRSKHGWHIDHIIPLDSFDLTNSEELARAWHYTNMQPLWAEDNIAKGNKLANHKANTP
jgi:hypothetical protein